ncbi:MAG: autotransporter domain-containing protein [Sphingomonadales bacterium]
MEGGLLDIRGVGNTEFYGIDLVGGNSTVTVDGSIFLRAEGLQDSHVGVWGQTGGNTVAIGETGMITGSVTTDGTGSAIELTTSGPDGNAVVHNGTIDLISNISGEAGARGIVMRNNVEALSTVATGANSLIQTPLEGIFLSGGDYDVTLAGEIVTQNMGGEAFLYNASPIRGVIDVDVLGTATLSTTGTNAVGISILTPNSAYVHLADGASITTTGDSSQAIEIDRPIVDAVVQLDEGSTLMTSGDGSPGLTFTTQTSGSLASLGPFEFDLNGSIITEGVNSTGASFLLSRPSSAPNELIETNVDVGGDIAVSGSGASGIFLGVRQNTATTLDVTGSISATGGGSGIVFVGNGSTTLPRPTVTIDIAEGASVIADGAAAIRQDVSLDRVRIDTDIRIAGHIEGTDENGVTLDLVGYQGDDTLTILPTATIMGRIDLGLTGAFNDTLIFDGDSGTTGTIDYGSGGVPIVKGQERIEKRGEGTWVFEGDAVPVETDLVPATVFEGSLVINANLPGMDVINQIGATVQGTGTIGNLNSSGTVAPGNSVGMLTVVGDFVQDSDGVLQIEIGPSGSSDLITATGTAMLDGTLEILVADSAIAPGDTFTFLIADGGVVDGVFDNVIMPANLDAVVVVGANQIDLQINGFFVPGCNQNGASVLCVGIDPDGFENADDTDLDVLVESDATVNNPSGSGLVLSDGATIENQGTIDVSGNGIDAGDSTIVTNGSEAAITAGGDGVAVDDGSTITNAGEIEAAANGIRGGTNLTVVNQAGATITGGGGTAILAAAGNDQVHNAGTINGDVLLLGGDDSYTTDVSTGVVNGGVVNGGIGEDDLGLTGTGSFDLGQIGAGFQGFDSLAIRDGGDVTATGTSPDVGPASIDGTSSLVLAAGSMLVTSDVLTVEAGGTFGGNGTLEGILVSDGTIAPGESIGTLTIDGNFVLNADGVLRIEIGPTGQNDVIAVTGLVDVDGTLDILLSDPNVQIGNVFTFLTAGDDILDGSFDTVIEPEGISLAINRNPNDINVEILAITVGGGCVQTGTGVLCTGIDGDGFENTTDTGLDVLVEAGAEVLHPSANGRGLNLGDDATVDNQGLIDADGNGILAGDSADITNQTGATIVSGSQGIAAGDDAVVTNDGTIEAGAVGVAAGANAMISNTGTIAGLVNEGISPSDAGVSIVSGSVINTASGAISGDSGVRVTGGEGTVENSGQIIGNELRGVQLDAGGVVANNSGASIAADIAVWIQGSTGDVDNDGTIVTTSATGEGVRLDNGGTIDNSGTIDTTFGGTAIEVREAVGTVVNSGLIDAGATGVEMLAGGMVSNESGATIQGDSGGVSILQAGTVINDGTIIDNGGAIEGAGVTVEGGNVTNNAGAMISGSYNGVALGADGGTVTNHGTIVTTGGSIPGSGSIVGRGVNLRMGGTLENTGTITGGTAGVEALFGATVINNSGTIQATDTANRDGLGISIRLAAGSVTNNGSILSGSQDIAIQFDPINAFDDTVTLRPGSVLQGSVIGGAGNDALILEGGTGTNGLLSLDDSPVLEFETIDKNGDGSWTVAGGDGSTTGSFAINVGSVTLDDAIVGADVTVGSGALLEGNGMVGDLTNSGELQPGMSIGAINVVGDLVQTADGVLRIEIGPTGINDLIAVAGTADMDGTLSLVLFDANIQAGDIFTFLTADGGVTDGIFDDLVMTEGLEVNVTAGANQIQIEVVSLTLGGCEQTGLSVLCEGVDSNGFENTTDTGLDIVVEPDAVVLNVDGNGLDLGDGNTVLNQGTINVAGDGIHAGDDNTIVNASSDTIIAGGSGIVTGDGSDVSNPGTITAEGDGIETGANSIVDNSGTITAGDDGMTVGSGSDVLNTGTIESLDIAILAGNDHDADLDGDGNAGIVNEGLIDSQVDGIVAGDNNVIVNRGDIFARHARADAPNDGDFNFLANSALTQQGTGIGVGSDNMVINEAGATITAHNAGIATALPDGTGNTIINEGTIDALSLVDPADFGFGTGILAGDDNFIENRTGAVIHANASGINAGAGSMVTNQAGATINAVTNGIAIGSFDGTGGTAVNDGEINISGGTFGGTGFLIWDGVTATNNGTINSAASGFYVNSGVGSVLVNNGEINAGTNGFDLFAGSTVTNGADGVVNATGGVGSDAIAAFGADNVIINEGELLSTGGNGIGIYAVGPTSIDNAGRIEGGAAAIQGGGGVETITNMGVIVGDVLLDGGDDIVSLGEGSVVTGGLDGGGGTDSVTSTGASAFEGSITAVEALTVEGGTLSLSLTAPSDVTATAVNGGRLELEGTLATGAATSGSGVLAGNGVIDGDLVNGGATAPGSSIGTLTITGDFTQTADGLLQIEFGPTGQTDLLDIGGAAVLDGTLDYYLVDNGVEVGDIFTFLTAGDGVTGTFSLANNALGAVGNFDVVYGDFDVSLTVLSLEGCIQTGSDVLCIGTDPNGFANTVDTGLDTLVETGAVVNNPGGAGLDLGDGGAIENRGTVDAAAEGIRLGADNMLVNRGTIRGGTAGIRLDGAGNTIDNQDGALIAGPVAITSAASGQTLINHTGATIDGDVVLSGGASAVELETGSFLIGGIQLAGAGDMVRLFGAGEDLVPTDIVGAELLVKEGAGTWTLNGALAVGETSLREGTLVVGGLVPVDDDEDAETPDIFVPASDAVLTSALVDVSGGILAGHGGIAGDLAVRGAGRVAPGVAGIGTLTVNGDVAFEPLGEAEGGVFQADLADDGGHDRLDVRADDDGDGGLVALAGSLDVVLDGEFVEDDPETPDIDESRDADGNRIIQADFSRDARVSDIIVAETAVAGTFEQVGFDGGPNDGAIVVREDDPTTAEVDETVRVPVFKGFLEYLPDRVRITSIPHLAPTAATPNQAAVADTLDAAVPYGLGTDPLTGVIAQVGVSGGIPAALDALHGEWYNAFHEAAINFSRGTLRQAELRSLEARSGTRASSAVTLMPGSNAAVGASGDGSRARFWIAAGYDTLDVDANNGFMGYGIDTLSGYLGMDYQLTSGLLLGAMGGFGNADLDRDGGTATGDMDSWQIAGYLSLYGGGWFLDVAGGYGEFDAKSSRDIGFGSVALSALSDHDGDAVFLGGRAGYGFALGNGGWEATPEIGLAYVRSRQDGFAETGAAPVNLEVDPLEAESLRLSGQLRLSRTVRTGNGGALAYYVRAGIAHELEDGLRPITARFAGTQADFTVFGQPASDTVAVFGAGISGEIASGISLFLDYAGELGGRFSSHFITGGARLRF